MMRTPPSLEKENCKQTAENVNKLKKSHGTVVKNCNFYLLGYLAKFTNFKSLFSTKIQVFHFQYWQKVIFRMVHPVLCLILIWQKPSGLEFVLQEIDYVTPLS